MFQVAAESRSGRELAGQLEVHPVARGGHQGKSGRVRGAAAEQSGRSRQQLRQQNSLRRCRQHCQGL